MLTTDFDFPFRWQEGRLEQLRRPSMEWKPVRPRLDRSGYMGVITWKTCQGEIRRMSFARVVWATVHGEFPPGNMDVDHINNIRSDNRPENLQLMPHADNMRKAVERAKALGKSWGPPPKLFPHQKKLAAMLPSSANWAELAERWGVHKVYLLCLRVRLRREQPELAIIPAKHVPRNAVR